MGALTISGRLAPEVIQRIVRQNFGYFRMCYEKGLVKKPDLEGKVLTRFVIDKSGSLSTVKSSGDLPASVVRCVEASFRGLSFPAPGGGVVTVSYPIVFTTASSSAPEPPPEPPPPPPLLQPPAEPAPPEGPWPIVVIHGDEVRIGDRAIASVAPIVAAGALERIVPVYDALEQQRTAWKQAHPRSLFPGVAGLRVDPETPMTAVKSVFQTMAYAGYPNLFVQLATERKRILDLSAQIPGPPRTAPAQPHPPPSSLHLRFEADGVKLTWRRGPTVVSEEVVKSDVLGAAICSSWQANGSHRDPADPIVDRLVIHGDNQLPFHDLAELSSAIDGCTRVRKAGGTEQRAGVFWLTLAMN